MKGRGKADSELLHILKKRERKKIVIQDYLTSKRSYPVGSVSQDLVFLISVTF